MDFEAIFEREEGLVLLVNLSLGDKTVGRGGGVRDGGSGRGVHDCGCGGGFRDCGGRGGEIGSRGGVAET